jgi:hypothetical protein
MSFVKALYGDIVGEDVSLAEGKSGFTKFDHQFAELVKLGKAKLFETFEEAEAYIFKTSAQLFNESYKSLNPPEGETVAPSSIDWVKGGPVVTDGVPSNIIPQPVKEEVKEPVKSKAEVKADDKK